MSLKNPGNPGKITERRCKRCGVPQTTVPPSGYCAKCEAWRAKQ